MLALTRKTDYALIALVHMAQDPEGCCSAREIATRYRVPLPLLMNILKLLTRRGLAKSARGPRGGYTLAVPAGEISLYDVIGAVEGPVQLVQCVEYKPRQAPDDPLKVLGCDLVTVCPVHSPIQAIHGKLVEFLSGVTLADVVAPGGCCKSAGQLAQSPLGA
ncbi:MAG: Rrf2 family transcriptional regulator [Phycisphaerae bacterium]|jgi:Rrf2 family protein